jgi:hypothetical protein
MELSKLFVSQRKLRAAARVPALVAYLLDQEPLPPILVSEDDDGTLQIEDGHHRATAFWLSGRTRLEPHEYLLFPRSRRRPRFGRIADLIARVSASSDVLDELLAALEVGRVRGPPRLGASSVAARLRPDVTLRRFSSRRQSTTGRGRRRGHMRRVSTISPRHRSKPASPGDSRALRARANS